MDIQSNSTEYIFDMLSNKYKLSKTTLRVIVRSQFECTKDIMKKADSYNNYWPSIRLIHLCSFIIKKGRREYYRRKSLKTLRNVYSQSEQQSGDRAKDALDTGV